MILLRRAIDFIIRYRFLTSVVLLAMLCYSIFAIMGTCYRENIFDILPFRDSNITKYKEISESFGQKNLLYFAIESDSKNIEEVSFLLRENLKENLSFSNYSLSWFNNEHINTLLNAFPTVFNSDIQSYFEKNISKEELSKRIKFFKEKLVVAPSAQLKNIFVSDPVGILSLWGQMLKDTTFKRALDLYKDGNLVSPSGALLLTAEIKFETSDIEDSAKLVEKIERIVSQIEDKSKVDIYWSGACRIAAENYSIAKKDTRFCIVATMLAMLLITLLSFKNRKFAFIALIPSGLGAVLGFAIAEMIFPEISPMAAAFAGISVGVSIDYAIHILSRLDSFSKIDSQNALETSLHFAKPISIVAGSTLIAFCVMAIFGESGFIQIGVLGGLGIFISAILCIFILPAILIGFKLNSGGVALIANFSKYLWDFCIKNKKAITYLYIFFTLSISFGVFYLYFDGSPNSFNGLGESARFDNKKLGEHWGSLKDSSSIAIFADSFDELKNFNFKLEKFLGTYKGIEFVGVSKLLPTSEQESENIERWKSFWTLERREIFRENLKAVCFENGVNFKIFSKNFELWNLSSQSVPSEFYTKIFKNRFGIIKSKYAFLIPFEFSNSVNKNVFVQDLQKLIPNSVLIDNKYISDCISQKSSQWLLFFASGAFVLVAVYLFVIFKRISLVGLVLLPVIIGLLWTFVTMGIFGIPINMVNSVFVIFAVCLAQDYAVFMIYDYKQNSSCVESIRSTMVSALTTSVAFGVLAFAEHPVLQSLGIVAGLSIVFIYLSSLILIPYFLLDTSSCKKNSPLSWNGKTHGGYFGNLCFVMLLKLGLIPAYTLLIFVSAFFTVFRAKLCIYARKYLELVLKRKVGVFSLNLYKLNFTFGMSMIDRVAYFADSKKIRIEDNAESVIKSALSKGKGVLILTSHVGGWQISSGELLKYGVPVGLVGAKMEDEKIARLFDSQIKRSSPIYIGSMGDASGFLTAYSQLKSGGIVAMHADRYVGGRFETIEFFGKKVRVPSACYKLAEKSGAEIVQVVCIKKSFATYCMNAFKIDLSKGESKASEAFFGNLEKVLKENPYQWFNFFDFWGQ